MTAVRFEAVTKVFFSRPALFNFVGNERRGKICALDTVNLSAEAGEILVLLGPNGSGKTTLLKLVATMYLPDAGRVIVHDVDTRLAAESIRRRVGFVVANERSFFPRLTARENLDFFGAFDDVPRALRGDRIDEVMEITGMVEHADTLAYKFSSGMYQRLGIARALLKYPDVLLMDEPTRSVDVAAAVHLWDVVRKLAKDSQATVLLATHNLEEALALADRAALLSNGRVIATTSVGRTAQLADLRSFYANHRESSAPDAVTSERSR